MEPKEVTTTITVSKTTRAKLASLGGKDDSFDDILRRLLNMERQ